MEFWEHTQSTYKGNCEWGCGDMTTGAVKLCSGNIYIPLSSHHTVCCEAKTQACAHLL